jgi:outer membrane protein assembly factor BamB
MMPRFGRGASGWTTIAGSSHPYLAAFYLATATYDPNWVPTVDAQVKAIALTTDHTHVIVAGAFTQLDGALSPAIGAVDPVTGASLPWAWHAPSPSFPALSIVSLAVDASGVYAGGTGNGGTFAALNPCTGALLWEGGVDGNVQAVTELDGIVYVGGHFARYCEPVLGSNRCPAVANRDKLIAVNAVTGALQSWHPAAGGDFTKLGGVTQQMFGMFSE